MVKSENFVDFIKLIINNFIFNTHSLLNIHNEWFYAWFGFTSCIIMIISSKILGFILKRDHNYYFEEKDNLNDRNS